MNEVVMVAKLIARIHWSSAEHFERKNQRIVTDMLQQSKQQAFANAVAGGLP